MESEVTCLFLSLAVDHGLVTEGGQGADNHRLASIVRGADLVANLTLRELEVRLLRAVLSQERQEAVGGDVEQGVLELVDDRLLHVVRRRARILVLLAREDVDAHHVGLGVTVLASLGGGDLDNLARLALDHHQRALADGAGLNGHGLGRARIRNLNLSVDSRHGGGGGRSSWKKKSISLSDTEAVWAGVCVCRLRVCVCV
eukprot:EC798631.1.p1 GENE.EC798631.1~~EC798631.1.p1  ORF type:complete len:211 (-),score=86.10 EC798631.1:87-689(-)